MIQIFEWNLHWAQLLVPILFKDCQNQHYQEFIDDVNNMERIQEIPWYLNHTSFHSDPEISPMLKISVPMDHVQKNPKPVLFYDDIIPLIATDSSGFTSGYCNHYYSLRPGKIRKHSLKNRFLSTPIIGPSPDLSHPIARFMIPKMLERYTVDVTKYENLFVMSWIESMIRKKSIAFSEKIWMQVQPIRSWNNEAVGGKYRQEMDHTFDTVQMSKTNNVFTITISSHQGFYIANSRTFFHYFRGLISSK